VPHKVSILIVSWNTCELTLASIESLPVGIDDGLDYEVIVVDNDSRDGSAEALRGLEGVRLIENTANLGYAAAVNQAYRAAEGDLILLLNSDLRFDPGALSALARFLDERPGVAGVGPLYLNPDRTPQAHHYRFPTFAAIMAAASEPLRHIPALERSLREYCMLDVDFSEPRPVPQPSASCLLLRRDCLPADELLDERYPIYFNDVDFARRLALAGHELWMTPEAVVLHEHGASTRLLGGTLARQHIGSLVRYLRDTQSPSRVRIYQALVLTQKLVLYAFRRPGALPPDQLLAALRGDPGLPPPAPLPD
jgi:GT2 family glycosyltransferase